ncbi:ADP-ribosylation factor GTPase-activating protein AGD12 [Linum grandiflorum]
MSRFSDLQKNPSARRKLRDLLQQSDNRNCADCGAPDPKWASANIGVFLCLKCCSVHRSLGSSKVLSVTLDDWAEEEIDSMIEVGGNAAVNSIYEAHIPDGVSKPKPDASHDDGMVEFIGLLKVKVVKGTNLAVRDMMSSDPYVVLSLGNQTVQTAAVSSNLNPVWDEELMLSIPQEFGIIKLQVYDYDTFSADDIMGEADIDLHPLINSAVAYGDPEMFGNMQIGKWLKSDDNALIEDSTINIVDGKVKQQVFLKLQNVESGELELELEWLSLEQ